VENAKGLTLEGVRCSIGGYANEEATLSPDCGGFWHVSWERAKEVIENGGAFTANDVRFDSWIWYGYGEDVPQALLNRVPLRYLR
jgi:hypothetical protein